MTTADPTANALIAEIYRTYGSLRSLIGEASSAVRLASLEVLTPGGVEVEPRQLTVAQMAKLSGHSRQAIQRAAGALRKLRLIEMAANPAHKRSPLIAATPEGREMKAHLEPARHAAATILTQCFDEPRLATLMRELEAARACIDDNATKILDHLRSQTVPSHHRRAGFP